MGALGCPSVCPSLYFVSPSLSFFARFPSEAFPCSGAYFLYVRLYLLRSFLRVSLGNLVCLVVSLESRMFKTFFWLPSIRWIFQYCLIRFARRKCLGRYLGRSFVVCHLFRALPSYPSGCLRLCHGQCLCLVDCLYGRPVKTGSSC